MSHGAQEFRVHHHISELTNLLGLRGNDGPGAEVYTDMLLKNMTPYITTQVSAHNAKRKIAESTKTPVEFLQKYDQLKSRNVRDLDSLVYLLSKLSDDEQTKSYLMRMAPDSGGVKTGGPPQSAGAVKTAGPLQAAGLALPPSGSCITAEELEKIKAELMKEVNRSVTGVGSENQRKALGDRRSSNVNLPLQPDWLFSRPYLTMDFPSHQQQTSDEEIVALGSLPLALQQTAIIEDLLFALQGIDGKYIHSLPHVDRYAQREFSVDPTLDTSLRELTKRLLPLCANYSTIVSFIEEKSAFEYGLVNHALGAAMRSLIKDYMVLVAQLEQQTRLGQLSLQKFWFYVQPTARTLEILTSVANSINRGECIGGTVLGLLHEKTSSLVGDSKGQQLCLFLTQSACVPYFEILEKWIYKGIIVDPYSEFLVEENENFEKERLQEDYNDAYWEQHYTICRQRIPLFLQRAADKILNAGKYLNVVRECGRDVQCPCAEQMVYSLTERHYVEQIERAYSFASRLLLDLILHEKELMHRLRSIKHYFLLDQGDFVVQFMDMAGEELNKTIDQILPSRLETLLELALRTSTANVDPFKDDLKVKLLPYDLVTQLFKILMIDTKQEKDYRVDPSDLHLSGLEAFTFDYIVEWPLSLVLNRKALTRYQMLFRHIFYCKHVERQLCNVWLSNKEAKLYTLQSSKWYSMAFALRQRMLNFVQNFEYYMMFEVVEPNWLAFQSSLESVLNIDDVLALHTDLLNNCLKDCMLTNPQLLNILHKLMMVCVTFSNFLQRIGQSTDLHQEESGLTATASLQATDRHTDSRRRTAAKVVLAHVDQLAGSGDFERTIGKFDSNFSNLLVDLLDKIMEFSVSNCEHKLMNILYRLDFNGFYSEKLERLSAERSMKEVSTDAAKLVI